MAITASRSFIVKSFKLTFSNGSIITPCYYFNNSECTRKCLDFHLKINHLSSCKSYPVKELQEVPVFPAYKYIDGVYTNLFEHGKHFLKEKPGDALMLVFLPDAKR